MAPADSSPPSSCGTVVSPRWGPHPHRQGHRADQPALHDLTQNQIWCTLVALTCVLTTWSRCSRWPTTPASVGTQTAAATPVLRRRPPCPLRPPNHAAALGARTLDRPAAAHHHHPARPGGPPVDPPAPVPTTPTHPRPVEPAAYPSDIGSTIRHARQNHDPAPPLIGHDHYREAREGSWLAGWSSAQRTVGPCW